MSHGPASERRAVLFCATHFGRGAHADDLRGVLGRCGILDRGEGTDSIDDMTVETLRTALRAQPFRPFDLCLADGRQLSVSHPEFVALTPPGRTIGVGLPDGSIEVVDLLLVTSLRPRTATTAGSPGEAEQNGAS
jgi:hypothetical protein